MGGVIDWFSDTFEQPKGFATQVLYPWATAFNNVDPGTATAPNDTWTDYNNFFGLDSIDKGGTETFNIAHELYYMREEIGGNPYNGVAAYNPSDLIVRIEDALDNFEATAQENEASVSLPERVEEAMEQAEVLLPDDRIEATVDAFEARQRTEHQASVSRTLNTLWLGGGILSTHTGQALALLEDGHLRTVAEYNQKLRLQYDQVRTQLATRMLNVGVEWRLQDVKLSQSVLAHALDTLRIVSTAEQDRIEKDLQYMLAQKFWNVDLLRDALNANSAMYGGKLVSGAGQTRADRMLAGVHQSISGGIQLAQATDREEDAGAMSLALFIPQLLAAAL